MGTLPVILLLLVLVIALRLSRLRDGKEGRLTPSAVPGLEVSINAHNAFVDAMTRLFFFVSLLGLAVASGFLATGDARIAIGLSIIFLGLPAVGVFNFRLSHSGTIELRDDALVIRAWNATHEYPWEDIDSLRVATWAETGHVQRTLLRLTGADASERFVFLYLRHRVHMSMGFWNTHYGTRVVGLPMLLRRIMLFVHDPETFARLALPYLRAVPPADVPRRAA